MLLAIIERVQGSQLVRVIACIIKAAIGTVVRVITRWPRLLLHEFSRWYFYFLVIEGHLEPWNIICFAHIHHFSEIFSRYSPRQEMPHSFLRESIIIYMFYAIWRPSIWMFTSKFYDLCTISCLRVHGEMNETLLVSDSIGKMRVYKTLRLNGLSQSELDVILQ